MDHAALKLIIDGEPANAARLDSEVLDWFNETAPLYRRLSDAEFRMVVVSYDLWAIWNEALLSDPVTDKTTTASPFGTQVTKRALGQEAIGIRDRSEGLNMANPQMPLFLTLMDEVDLLGAKVDGVGVARSALESLATMNVNSTRWQREGLQPMDDTSKLDHISKARAL